MSAILFDLDGVLYEGDRAIPGAADAVQWFDNHNIPHLFLTNTSSRPRSALVDKLSAFGISTSTDQFLTPPVAACQWLKQNIDGPIALFIPKATRAEFSEFEICTGTAEAAAVIIGDMGEQWDFNLLNQAFKLLIKNPETRLIALGMTRYWRADDGLRLDAGPYVTALSYATGKQPVITGKPAVEFFDAALNILNCNRTETVMIGDDIKGDIEAANNAGLFSVLVRTGKFTLQDLEKGIEAGAIIDSIANLVEWWSTRN